jgi:amino acid transporter
MLLAYLLMSTIVIAVVFSMAELSALAPTSGSYVRHTGMWIDPSAFSAPSTLTSIAVLCQYWKPDLNAAIPITVFMLATLAANVFKVRVYGEIEFGFAILKILTIVGERITMKIRVGSCGPSSSRLTASPHNRQV